MQGLAKTLRARRVFRGVRAYRAAQGEVKSLCRYEAPPNIFWDDQKYRGEAYPAFAWSVQVAQVAVDTVTYSAEVEEFWSVQEVGRVLNPCWPAGRLRAASRRASAMRSMRRWCCKNGHMANNQMTNYIMPTAEDVPPIHVYFEEIPFQYGGYGAKGIGELPHDGPAPAILNAIRDATGVGFHSIPLLPEDLFAQLAAREPVAGDRHAMSECAAQQFASSSMAKAET
jgi:CO/xanthine dehydrogenase Mo-binding subunit